MSVAMVRNALLWCSVINYSLLVLWVLLYLLSRDCFYRVSGKWFRISREQYDTMQYGGIIIYKLGIVLFNIVPYIALRLIG
jgi:hypothetical protein